MKQFTDDQIVARISELAKKHNACNIQVTDGKATCRDGEPCCSGCKHLSDTGCTVSAHGCRMWFCWTAWEFMPVHIRAEIYELIISYKADVWFRHDLYSLGQAKNSIHYRNTATKIGRGASLIFS